MKTGDYAYIKLPVFIINRLLIFIKRKKININITYIDDLKKIY